MNTNLNQIVKGRICSHALISLMLLLGLSFADGEKTRGKKLSEKTITWAYNSYKIKSNAVLSLVLPNTVGSGETLVLTGCYDTGNLALYKQGAKTLEFIRTVGQVKGGITDLKLLSMNGAQNMAVVAHEGKGSIQIYNLKENAEELSLFHGPHGVTGLEIADFNGDGLGDIIPVSYEGMTEVWFENQGNQGFVKRKLPMLNRKVTAAKVADFDRDGDQDLLLASDYSKMIMLFVNDGKGNFKMTGIADGISGVLDIEVLDMNVDGKMDVAYASHKEKRIQLLLQREDRFERKNVSTKLHSLNNLEVFDLGKDGRPDLIISSFDDDAIRVIQNSANGLKEHQFQASIPAPTDIAVKSDPGSMKTTLYVSSMAINRVYTIDMDIPNE